MLLENALSAITIVAFGGLTGDYVATAASSRRQKANLRHQNTNLSAAQARRLVNAANSHFAFRVVLATRCGLLFTVLGLIVGFYGTESGKAMSLASLAVALITTAAGLGLATLYECSLRSYLSHVNRATEVSESNSTGATRKQTTAQQACVIQSTAVERMAVAKPHKRRLSKQTESLFADMAGMGQLCDADFRW